MKNILFPFLTVITLLLTVNSFAQINRADSKKSVAFKANYQRTSAGYTHTIEIREGTLWAWGDNSYGQLGDGTTVSKSSPVQIGTDNTWVTITTGYYHTLGLKADGTLWAWGYNNAGQLGDGTTVNKSIPAQVGTDNKWISISAGEFNAIGIKSDGTLWGWGQNSDSQLGDGTIINRLLPIQIGTDNKWINTTGGNAHTVGVKSDGTLWAWGNNYYGQLGDGTTVNKSSPIQIGTDNNWVSINTGRFYTIGLKSDGTIWAWGANAQGQLGDGSIVDKSNPVQVGIDNKWVALTAGDAFTLGLKSDGTLWAWGYNGYGQLGDGSTITINAPLQIGADNKWVTITAGGYHTLGLKSDGTLWAWGSNPQGQLGDGTLIQKTSPVQTSIILSGWLSIAGGESHSLGLKSDGTLWAWGYNSFGQLGDGSIADKSTPVQIGTDNKWVSITVAGFQSFGLKSDGTLWAWGYNNFGQLGDGTNASKISPVQIGIDNKWVSITAGAYHTMGLKSDGTLWAWGYNLYGQLGDGTTVDKNAPVQIGAANNWVSVKAGGSHSLGLKSNGTLFTWGRNSNSQIGDGTNVDKTSPVQIGADNKWTSITGGGNHSLGLKSDGTFWAWGDNGNGQLGDGTSSERNIPVQIGIDNKWINITAGWSHTLGLKSEGTIWAWGYNANGQLGDGTTASISYPIQIGSDNNWVVNYSGAYHTLGLKSDRTLFCATGKNTYGQIGNCSTIQSNLYICSSIIPAPPAPTNTTSPGNLSICSGNNTMLTATGSGTLSWYSAATGGSYLGGGTSYTSPVLSVNTTYYVQDSSSCGLVSATRTAVLITVNPLPSSPVVNSNSPICLAASLNLTASTITGASYSWTGPSGFSATTQNPVIPGVAFINAGLYSVTVNLNGCNSVSASTNVVINPLPAVNAGLGQTVCPGDTATLNGSATGGATPYSFNWYDGSTNYNIQNLLVSPASSLTYTLTVVDAIGCSNMGNTTISVLPNTNILGHVGYSGGDVGASNVVLYSYLPFLSQFDTVQLTATDASGNFSFSAVNSDNYLIEVFPSSSYPTLVPTYYGNSFLWDSATVITHGCIMSDTINILTIEETPALGPGVLHGVILEDVGFRTPGDPIPGVDVKLGRNPGGQLITSTQTDSSGNYSFNNVAFGNYTIYADIPGLGRDSSYTITVDSLNTTYNYLNYIVDSTTINIVPDAGVGINTITGNTTQFVVFPNPSMGNFVIDYSLTTNCNVSLRIYNPLGVLIAEPINNRQAAGAYKQIINIEDYKLNAGIYFIILVKDGRSCLQRLVITK